MTFAQRFAVYRTIINTANLPQGMTRPPDAIAKCLSSRAGRVQHDRQSGLMRLLAIAPRTDLGSVDGALAGRLGPCRGPCSQHMIRLRRLSVVSTR